MKRLSNITRFPRPGFLRAGFSRLGFLRTGFLRTGFLRTNDGLRAVAEHAPQAEALAASWIERARPLAMRVYALRRRIATVVVGVLAVFLLAHVTFGANGMIAYRQKRAEYLALRQQIEKAELENGRYTQQIQALKTDEKAVEKEAREQLGYAKPGEYVYVQATPAKPVSPPVNRSAKK